VAVKRLLAVAGALAIGALTLIAAPGTGALWRDSDQLSGGTIRSGELSLVNGGAGTQSADYAFTELAGTGLAPGRWSQAPLTIRNAGSADLVYRLATTTASDPTGMAASLRLRVQQVAAATSCPTGVGAAEPTGPVTGLYTGPLLGASTTPARQLAVGASEALCLRVTLDSGAPSAAQGSSTVITFTFTAVST
jgi:hypothetical protein